MAGGRALGKENQKQKRKRQLQRSLERHVLWCWDGIAGVTLFPGPGLMNSNIAGVLPIDAPRGRNDLLCLVAASWDHWAGRGPLGKNDRCKRDATVCSGRAIAMQ